VIEPRRHPCGDFADGHFEGVFGEPYASQLSCSRSWGQSPFVQRQGWVQR